MKRVLIVEDSPEICSLLELTLRMEGYEVVAASTGETALRMVATQQPDLIVLDVNLPGINGFQVAQRLQDNDDTRSIPIIFLTARSDVDDRVLGLSLGVDYIVKPFAVSEFLARVRIPLRDK